MEGISNYRIKEKISVKTIQKNICVSAPYFALHDFELFDNEVLQANFTIENLDYSENFILSSGESGRHLAILGLCALSIQNPVDDKFYYLAIEAVGGNVNVDLESNAKQGIKGRLFTARAKVIMLDVAGKSGKVETRMFDDKGTPVSWLNVTYKIFRCDLFKKLFGRYYDENAIRFSENPYHKTVKLHDLHFDENHVYGKTLTIKPEQCAGHFDHYPALPVAVLCSVMFEIAGKHFCHSIEKENPKYSVVNVGLNASRLAFAGEFLLLKSNIIQNEDGNNLFVVLTTDYEGKQVARLEVTFCLNG